MLSFLDDMSLRIKLYMVPALVMVCLAAVVGWSSLQTMRLTANISDGMEQAFGRVARADDDVKAFARVHMEIYRLVTVAMSSAQESDYAPLIEEHKAMLAKAREDVKELQKMVGDTKEMKDLLAQSEAYAEAADQTYAFANDGALAAMYLAQAQTAYEAISKDLGDISKHEFDAGRSLLAKSRAQAKRGMELMMAGGAVLLVLAGVLAFVITAGVVGPLAQVGRAMEGLMNGKYAVKLDGGKRKDEIGAMVRAVGVFGEAMKANAENTQKEQEAARQKLEQVAAMQQLVADAKRMADEVNTNIVTMASAMNEMSASSEHIRQQTQQSLDSARAAGEESRVSTQAISDLTVQANKIGDVVSVINGIAEQTNLLALNASIEAARAGDAGRGFAVVADEVKKLSTQTATATEDIQQQIGLVQKFVRDAVGSMEKINAVVTKVEEASDTVSRSVNEQNVATQDIANSVDESRRGVEGLFQVINKIHETTVDA